MEKKQNGGQVEESDLDNLANAQGGVAAPAPTASETIMQAGCTAVVAVMVGNKLYVGTHDSEVLAINWKTQECVWRYRDADREFPRGPKTKWPRSAGSSRPPTARSRPDATYRAR